MSIKNTFENPLQIYQNVRGEIPKIKILNKKIMNKLHSLQKSEDFWWAITGEHAIYAYYLLILSNHDARVIIDINNSKKEKITVKQVSTILSNILFRDQLINKKENFENKINLDDLLTDDYIKNFENNSKPAEKIFLSFNFLTKFLEVIHFIIFFILYFFEKLKIKFYTFLFKKENTSLNFKLPSESLTFEFIYLSILPNKFQNQFPKWFVKISDKIVSNKNKWITNFGYELNIFQQILIAISYEKYAEKYIEIVPHGAVLGEIDIWYLWRLSLFPDLRINSFNYFKSFKSKDNQIFKKGILFCPMVMPYIADFLSLNNFRLLMDVHKKTIDLFIDALKKGKNIKVRYKDFNYLRGHAGQFFSEETQLPVEMKNFEESYQDYSVIISVPHGSIGEICKFNKIPFISYYHPIVPTDTKRYQSMCDNKSIFNQEMLFLDKVKEIISSL